MIAKGRRSRRFIREEEIPQEPPQWNQAHLDMLRAFEVSGRSLFLSPCFRVYGKTLLILIQKQPKKFSYGSRTGIELPGEIRGNIPNDLDSNRNELYALAIGQHSLVVTPLQTAVMLGAIANGGRV